MAELTITTFLTLDGVMQAPGAPREDTSGDFPHGGWLVPHADEDMMKIITAIFAQADAFLLGRATYDIFAAYWPKVTDPDDPVGGRLNRLPKFVSSRSKDDFSWHNTSLVRNVVAEIPKLKHRFDREIQVHGSAGLVQALIANDLVDKYRLLTFPVVLGGGKRLFGAGAIPRTLKLVRTDTTSAGMVMSVYRPAGELATGSFALEDREDPEGGAA